MFKPIRRMELTKGGTAVKQGEIFTLGFQLFDADGLVIIPTVEQTLTVKIANKTGVVYETVASVVDERIEFTVNENIGAGKMRVELTVADGVNILQKYPATGYIELFITASLDDIGTGTIYTVTAEEMFTLIADTQAQFVAVVNRETDTDAMSRQASINTAGVDKVNLKARLDEEYNIVTQQLADNERKLFFANAESFGARTTQEVALFDSGQFINQAIDAVFNAGGGTVYLRAGTYRTSIAILLKPKVTLKGAGLTATEIRLNNGANCNVIEVVGGSWNSPTEQSVQDLSIAGNGSGQTAGTSHGIYVAYSCMYTYINNVKVTGCKDDGIRYVSSHRNLLKNSVFGPNFGNGVTVTSGILEGTGTSSDNHVEMGFITATDNGGHGFLFNSPVDTKCMNLTATNNTLDGISIQNPSGGWGNMIDMIMCMNNRNGIAVYGGADLNLSNIACTGSTEYNLKVELISRVSISKVSCFGGTLGNIFLRDVTFSDFADLKARITLNVQLTNILLQACNSNNFNNIHVVNGLDGLDVKISSNNNFSNVQAEDQLRSGVRVGSLGGGGNAQYNRFNNVFIKSAGSTAYPDSTAFLLDNATAPSTIISNFTNIDSQTTKQTLRGIDLSTSPNCIVASSIGKGKEFGVRKTTTNTTSIIGADVIQELIV